MNKNNKFIGLVNWFLLAIMGGLLGALGGCTGGDKNLRRIGIPLLLTIVALIAMKNIWVLTILLMIVILSVGYGIPDNTDAGAPIGVFFWNIFHNNVLASIFTRGTIGLLCCLACLSIPLIKQNWLEYGIGSFIIIMTFAFLSWQTLGSFNFGDKSLTYSEFITYYVLTLVNVWLINYDFLIKTKFTF